VVAGAERHLLQDGEGSRQRFREHRGLVGDGVGDHERDGEVLGERAVRAEDAHDATAGTVPPEAPPAGRATPAGVVDLPDDPLFGDVGRPVDDLTDELMTRNTGEAHVSGQDLQVGGAHTGQVDSDDGLVLTG
jgi:hypothetical protein